MLKEEQIVESETGYRKGKDTNIKRRLERVNFGPGFYDSISPALKNVYVLITLSTTFNICILFDILFCK